MPRTSIAAALLLSTFLGLTIVGCDEEKKDEGDGPPPQGPFNASFEDAGATSPIAYGWGRTGQNTLYLTWGAQRKTGTGTVPSDGAFMMEVHSQNEGNSDSCPETTVYQDCDLTASTTLMFDYEVSGAVYEGGTIPGSYPSTATIEILFQSTGTVVLWSRTWTGTLPQPPFPADNFSEQAINETVTLPATTQPGRLTIRATTTTGYGTTRLPPAYVTFRFDKIRVQ